MKPLVCVCVVLALVGLPAAAFAQVTQTYQYDVNGRLTGVATAGLAGTNTAAYVYDKADNRTSRSQTGTTAYAMLTPQAYDTMWPFPSSVPPSALTLDTLFLTLEGSGEVALGGWDGMGQHDCIGTELSLSRWPQARTDLVSGELATTAVWRSHASAAANAEFPDGGGEETTSTGGLSHWSARIGGERCSS